MRAIRALTAVLLIIDASAGHGQTARSVTMYKQVGCGCCTIWAQKLQKAGFKVSSVEVVDMDRVKTAHGVPRAVQTCHTATIDGYVVEGHVPLDAIEKLLKERPKVVGIGVAGRLAGDGERIAEGAVRRARVRPRGQDERLRQEIALRRLGVGVRCAFRRARTRHALTSAGARRSRARGRDV